MTLVRALAPAVRAGDHILPQALSNRAFAAALVFVAVITALRVAALFGSPLELYPDEAQYWLWSRTLAFGYFSKPPLIAWLIRGTTLLGGQSEPWVRLSAPLLHGAAAAVLGLCAQRLRGGAVAAVSALVYDLGPGVDLSSAVIATDAPLMLGLSLALLSYAIWWTSQSSLGRTLAAGGFGVCLGLSFLAKYAALYFCLGALLHALVSPEARRRWRPLDILIAIGGFLGPALPNILWNAAHQFSTVRHTVADADLSAPSRRLSEAAARGLGFMASQAGVFGPAPFALLLIEGAAAVRGMRERRSDAPDGLLACFLAPPLAIVLAEALLSRANANWAGAAYGPASILCADLLVRRRSWRLASAALGLQLAMALGFLVVWTHPDLADRVSLSNSFKRARGWLATARAVEAATRSVPGPLQAVMVDDRFLFNALAYYGRDEANRPAARLAAPLRIWVRAALPANQAESSDPLADGAPGPVLLASAATATRQQMLRDFSASRVAGPDAVVTLDPRHDRTLSFFLAQRYHRRLRAPETLPGR